MADDATAKMAGGARELPKWQIPLFGGVTPSFVLADPIGCHNDSQPAKTADSVRKLPKWQAPANPVPIEKKLLARYLQLQTACHKIFFFWHEIIFGFFKRFFLHWSILTVD